MPKWEKWLDDDDEDFEPSFEKIPHKKKEYDDEKLARIKKLKKPSRIPRPEKE